MNPDERKVLWRFELDGAPYAYKAFQNVLRVCKKDSLEGKKAAAPSELANQKQEQDILGSSLGSQKGWVKL